jgi:hypothetical protein
MKRFLREVLLKNWNLKLTAILLTLILWLFVKGELGAEKVVALPLEVLVPRQMEITNDPPATIVVTMRGSIQPLPTCIVNLQEASEGEHTVMLTPQNVREPQGSRIEVLHLNPAQIVIKLEQTLSKEVDIIVPIQGELPKGFEIYRKSSQPDRMTVSGPRSQMESLEEISTEAISIADLKQTTSFFVRLSLGDRPIRPASTDPIQMDIRVGPRRSRHAVKQVPIIFEEDVYAVSPKAISVRVLAPPEVIKDLAPEIFTVAIDPEDLETLELPAKVTPIIELPDTYADTVDIEGSQPSEVTVSRLTN